MQKHVALDLNDSFTFRISNLASCHYCGYSGVYSALRTHHRTHHGDQPFAIVDVRDESRCALCSFQGENIVTHAAAEHSVISELKLFNAIALNEASLKDLLECDLYKKVRELISSLWRN